MGDFTVNRLLLTAVSAAVLSFTLPATATAA
jgi:hypothetical protein